MEKALSVSRGKSGESRRVSQKACATTGSGTCWTWSRGLWALCLLLWLIVLYGPSFGGPFVFDDRGHVWKNPRISQFPPDLDWHRPQTRPLVVFTFAVEQLIAGESPLVHRLGNVVIHSAAAVLLAELVYRIQQLRTGRSERWFALAVATLWAVHPLTSQAVAYIVQRYESMMGFFFFAFLLAVVLHEQTRRRRWIVLGGLAFVLGLLSKTVMVTALPVAMLLDRTWLSESWREVVRKRAWLYLPPLIPAVAAALLLVPGITQGRANIGFGGNAPPLALHLAAQAEVLFRYIGKAFVPIGLNIDHGLTVPATAGSNTLAIVGALALIFAGVVACVRGSWTVGFFILAPLLVLAPTSSVIPTADLMVEHRVYVPLAIFVIGASLLVWKLCSRFAIDSLVRSRFVLVLPLMIVLVFSFLTRSRAADYRSGISLWYQSLSQNADNARAAQNLANTAIDQGQPESLLPLLVELHENAVLEGESTGILLGRIGEELVKHGRFLAAQRVLEQAIAQDPSPIELRRTFHPPSRLSEFASHRVNAALTLARLGRPEQSRKQLRVAFEISDTSPHARAIAGDLLQKMGYHDEAIEHFERALDLKPDWEDVKNQLANLRRSDADAM